MAKANAVVQVTVEVCVGSWGNDCSLSQAFDQAKRSAIDKVRTALKLPQAGLTIKGEPKVTLVTHDEE